MSPWRRPARRAAVLAVAASAAVAVPAAAMFTSIDFGKQTQDSLQRKADRLYGGIGTPLAETAPTVPGAAGADSVALAGGLEVQDVLRGDVAGPQAAKLTQNADMIALWPSDAEPEWAIVCIENGTGLPGIQRVKLDEPGRGTVETILSGTQGCDGIRRTPWSTIVATEERGDGWALEIYDPLHTSDVAFNRATGELTGADAGHVRTRPALGRFAWEGLHVTADGSVYAGDELGPKSRANGGALFKFVSDQKPATPLSDATKAMLADPANAAASPLAAGRLYALEIGDATNRGQGNRLGRGKWVGPIDPAIARSEGVAKGTGFYRPEDLQVDPLAEAAGQLRVCWTNTGNAALGNHGEVLCLDDRPDGGAATGATPEVQQLLAGNPKMNQPDNIAFQPGTGIVYVIEDTPSIDGVERPGDIWACLRDGADRDLQSDGCVMVASVRTAGAEPTGFIFDGSGERAYVHVQHSPDDPATALDEGSFDEMLVIDGFEPRRAKAAR